MKLIHKFDLYESIYKLSNCPLMLSGFCRPAFRWLRLDVAASTIYVVSYCFCFFFFFIWIQATSTVRLNGKQSMLNGWYGFWAQQSRTRMYIGYTKYGFIIIIIVLEFIFEKKTKIRFTTKPFKPTSTTNSALEKQHTVCFPFRWL